MNSPRRVPGSGTSRSRTVFVTSTSSTKRSWNPTQARSRHQAPPDRQEGAWMSRHRTGTREEWLAARNVLLDAEKAHMRRGDEIAHMPQQLPGVAGGQEHGL